MGSHRAHPRSSTPNRRALAFVDGVVRWRRKPGAVALGDAISLDETTVGRELKALGFAKIYAQNELAVEAFKKNFPAELAKIRARLPKGVEIELWWQDEARIGQKNKLTRRWARRGTRRAPRPAHRMGLYLRASCPAKGKGAGLDALVRHRRHGGAPHRDQCRRRSRRPCGADRRSGRLALDAQLAIPDNITVLALPPRECLAIHARQLVVEPESTKTSSRCAAKPGTTSSTNHGRSCPSACANPKT